MSARMVAQKGLDLILGADLLSIPDAQFIFLGAGEHRYHEALGNLAAAAPDRMAGEIKSTPLLARPPPPRPTPLPGPARTQPGGSPTRPARPPAPPPPAAQRCCRPAAPPARS